MSTYDRCQNSYLCRLKAARWLSIFSLCVLTACAQYHEKPLPKTAELAASINLRSASADPPALTMADAVSIALTHNPELRAQRAQEQVAAAQLLSVRRLPDPQLSVGFDHPTSHQPDLVNAFSAGLSYELQTLITRGATLNAAKANAAQTHLNLIWQEWQVAQQVRLLYVRYLSEEQSLALLDHAQTHLQQQYQAGQQALHDNDVALTTTSSDLAALTDLQSRSTLLAQQHTATSHELKLAMGAMANVSVRLNALPAPGTIDPVLARAQLSELPRRRPDLLALQAGYTSQEAKLRQEILAQYPGISIGISRARDTSAVYTSGFNIALRLPLFSGNRPAIALEQATREQLYQEYRARLASNEFDISRLLQLQQQIDIRQTELAQQLPLLEQTARNTELAFARGDFDSHTRNASELASLNGRLEQIDLMRAGWENRIALETLLAWSPPLETNASTASIEYR